MGHKIVLYFSWSRPGESGAPLAVIENRFPTLFETRRLGYPRFVELSDPTRFDQGIGGFLDHIQKPNFAAFAALAGESAVQIERVADDGAVAELDAQLLGNADTLIVISFDSFRTNQAASSAEVAALRQFLAQPGNLAFICPHHDIGAVLESRVVEFHHHGDRAIPPQQRFGGFARSLLAGLGVPVNNCFGLRPAVEADGSPAAIEVEAARDRLNILQGVETFNLHPHLPHLERLGEAVTRLEVLARQKIDLTAPPHPFTRDGRTTFDALLQSRAETFAGTLFVGDTTLWSSTAGGLDCLQRLWRNVIERPRRS